MASDTIPHLVLRNGERLGSPRSTMLAGKERAQLADCLGTIVLGKEMPAFDRVPGHVIGPTAPEPSTLGLPAPVKAVGRRSRARASASLDGRRLVRQRLARLQLRSHAKSALRRYSVPRH